MTIHYLEPVKAIIEYDGDLTFTGWEDTDHTYDELVEKAKNIMGMYGFSTAVVYDAESMVPLIRMERDINDFYPESDEDESYDYSDYDDADDCGCSADCN